jgi:hypothetical protein
MQAKLRGVVGVARGVIPAVIALEASTGSHMSPAAGARIQGLFEFATIGSCQQRQRTHSMNGST